MLRARETVRGAVFGVKYVGVCVALRIRDCWGSGDLGILKEDVSELRRR
jgi:hypothetical protein